MNSAEIAYLLREKLDEQAILAKQRALHVPRSGAWIDKAAELAKVQQLRKKYELLEGALLEELKQLSENESSRGGGFVFTKSERKGCIDYNRIPELNYVDVELYRKQSSYSWKLSLELE